MCVRQVRAPASLRCGSGLSEALLSELVRQVAREIDRFCEGELDAFDVDNVLFQYSRAARELWKFCNMTDVEMTEALVVDRPSIDWWERGATHKR